MISSPPSIVSPQAGQEKKPDPCIGSCVAATVRIVWSPRAITLVSNSMDTNCTFDGSEAQMPTNPRRMTRAKLGMHVLVKSTTAIKKLHEGLYIGLIGAQYRLGDSGASK